MNDIQIEKEIIEKGLTAPRVTLEHIHNCVVKEVYFSDETLTICVITLRNGFKVIGESACASPENFNEELGKKIAKDNAISKVWMLEGYVLKEKLFNGVNHV